MLFRSPPQWLELVLGWLARVFASTEEEEEEEEGAGTPQASTPSRGPPGGATGSLLQQWRRQMHQFFCRVYVNMRIEELFSIIRGEGGPGSRRGNDVLI